MLTSADLRGLWRRDYLRTAGHDTLDTSTWVAWLQGQRLYCDLRQASTAGAAGGARCLRDLDDRALGQLAQQQGFAGLLTVSGDVAEWHRYHDYQPPGPHADRARVVLTGDVLIETGTEQHYEERWTRETGPREPTWEALLSDVDDDARAVLVGVGAHLMYVRERRCNLPKVESLSVALQSLDSLRERQDLLDFEISFGRRSADGHWLIERSTLPYKAGRVWQVRLDAAGDLPVQLGDLGDDGTPRLRRYRLSTTEACSATTA